MTRKKLNKLINRYLAVLEKEDEAMMKKKFQCHICEQLFSQKQQKIRHLRIHTGEKPYQCDLCKKKFRESHHLTTHKRIHSKERPFVCEVCQTEHRDLSNLKCHMLCAHSDKRSFMCIIDQKCYESKSPPKFKKKSHRLIHFRAHMGYRVRCDMCKNTYSTNGNKNRHKKAKHHILPKFI